MNLTEQELERRMLDEGEAKFWRTIDRTKRRRIVTREGAGVPLLWRAVDALVPRIEAWIKKAKRQAGHQNVVIEYLTRLPAPLVAFVSARAVLDSIEERRDLANLAARLGRKLMDEERLRYLKKHHPIEWERSWRRLSRRSSHRNKVAGFNHTADTIGAELPEWPVKDRVRVGAFMVEMVRTYTGLIDVVNMREYAGRKPKTRSVIVPTKECLDWMGRVNERLSSARPRLYPMVEPPLPWRGVDGGGYHLAELQEPAVLTNSQHLDQVEAAVTADPDGHGMFLRALNAVQSVPWRVNQRVLDVARALWARGGGVAGLPAKDSEDLPPYPPDEDMDARMAWRKLARRVYIKRAEEGARRVTVIRQLAVAEERGGSPMYFPHVVDFRGRAYSAAAALHPQGDDLARGLLEFAEPGAPWADPNDPHGADRPAIRAAFALHGANTFGKDKLPLSERLAWVRDHHQDIVDCTVDPVERRWWTEASEPWQFLAFCFEYVEAYRGRRGTEGSRLPVQIDGSNNGLQVYAMLSRDPASARATNCVPTDRPEDVYQRVADRTMAELRFQAEFDPRAEEVLELVEDRWDRKAVKRPVMVLPYGGTKWGIMKYVREWFDETCKDRWRPGVGKLVMYLAGVLWDQMGKEMPGALAVMDWLRTVAHTFAEEGRPLWWVSPSGFLARQEYPKRRSGRVKTSMGEVVKFTRYREDVPNTIDARRQSNGFPPNLVHSFDAAVLHEAVTRAAERGIKNLRVVHDAYATTADRIDELGQIVRDAFADTFVEDPLGELHRQLAAQAPDGAVVPEPPPRGSLDVNEARRATYLFS